MKNATQANAPCTRNLCSLSRYFVSNWDLPGSRNRWFFWGQAIEPLLWLQFILILQGLTERSNLLQMFQQFLFLFSFCFFLFLLKLSFSILLFYRHFPLSVVASKSGWSKETPLCLEWRNGFCWKPKDEGIKETA